MSRKLTCQLYDCQSMLYRIMRLQAFQLKATRSALSGIHSNCLHIKTAKDANQTENKTIIKTAGLILIRQRPGTAKGVCFITLEDETGTTNLVVFPKLFDKYRKEISRARLLMVEGVVERTEVTHIIVRRILTSPNLLGDLTADSQ
jgi:DNA polymerase III alpha subunit